LKKEVQQVCLENGVSVSAAITFFLKEVAACHGIPYGASPLMIQKPAEIALMSPEQFTAFLQAGIASEKTGDDVSLSAMKERLQQEFGICLTTK
jgi:antitoxin component of RelBE/YafQ-DinJ toxin-antitoxin module